MRVLPIGAGTVRQAPFPDGPAAEVLVDEQVGGGQLAAAHVTIPPGGAMPDHAHGESTALVVPLTGELLIASGQHQEQVTQGVVVLLDHRERVRLANETNEPVTLLAVFAPAGFVRALSSWPATTTTAASTGTSGRGGDGAAWAEVHRQVVEQATHAPSVHNTQPWRFASYAEGLDLYADSARQLPVLDPRGRQLHLSCGAALLHAQVAARARGLTAEPQLLPDPADPAHLARLRLTSGKAPSERELAVADAIALRHTYRDAFSTERLPDALLERLRLAAEAQGGYLRALTHPDDLLELQSLLSRADTAEQADPAYRQELAAWVHTGPADDGIPRAALPADPERGSSLRLREFAPNAAGPPSAGPPDGSPPAAERPDVVVIISDDDSPRSWLQAGQALGAVLLQAAHEGVMAQPLAQATDLPGSRQRLGAALGLVGTPQLALRLGYPTGAAAPGVATTSRRAVADVLSGHGQDSAGG